MIKKIIDKWKINRNLLAAKMDMSKGAFNNKLSERPPYKFSDEELAKLKKVIAQLVADLNKIIK